MATSKSTLDSFQKNWNTTAAWAQSQGVKYNSYYPIYQMDSQRILSGYQPMSQAERERAIMAAVDPNAAQQKTPSTASSPFNIIGNTVTDLRNIFTGVGDIAIHPLHNGLVDSVKNTFDLLDGSHHLTGGSELQKLGDLLTSTVASWIPGVADLGTVLQAQNPLAGFEQLMEHPVSSYLDILPFSKLAGSAVLKDSTLADRAGLTPEQAAKGMTMGRLARHYLLNTDTKTPSPFKGPEGMLTVGDKLSNIMGKTLGTNSSIADMILGVEQADTHGTTIERMVLSDAHESYHDLNDAQREQVHEIIDPSNTDTSLSQRLEDPKYDEVARQAARDFINGPGRFMREEELAAFDIANITDPTTGKLKTYSTTSHPDILDKRDDYVEAMTKWTEMYAPLQQYAVQAQKAEQFIGQHSDNLQRANEAARKVDVSTGNYTQNLPGTKRLARLSFKSIANKMFGEGGTVDSAIQLAKEGKLEDARDLLAGLEKRLEKWGVGSVDASTAPEFAAVAKEVHDLHTAVKAALEVRKRTEKAAYGAGEEFTGATAARDQLHQGQKDALDAQHKTAVADIKKERSTARARLQTTIAAKARHIRETSRAEVQRQRAWLTEQRSEINKAYGLEKRRAFLHHLEAGENARAKIAYMRREIRAGRLEAPKIPVDSVGQLEQGLGMQPGSLGTKEGIDAELLNIENRRLAHLARHEAEAKQQGLIKDEATIKAQTETQLKDLELVHVKMRKQLDDAAEADRKKTDAQYESDAKKLEQEHLGKKAREGKAAEALQNMIKAKQAFADAVWAHPPDVFTDVYFNTYAKHLKATEAGQELLGRAERVLSEKGHWSKETIDRLRTNDAVLTQLVQLASKELFKDYGFTDEDKKILDGVEESAKNETRRLADDPNVEIAYVPHISSTQVRAEETGSYGIKVRIGKGIPTPDAAHGRVWDMDRSRFDVMASFSHGVKQILDRDATVEYVTRYLEPRVVTGEDLSERILQAFPEAADLHGESLTSFMASKAKEWGLVKFNPEGMFGFTMPKWTKAGDMYLDGAMVKALEKLTAHKELPTVPFYDKATRLFRYSILGLSPRYTAHILFGGTFLLALRSSPGALLLIGKAHDYYKTGQLPEELDTHATQMGTTETELRSMKTAIRLHQEQAGRDSGRLLAQEDIETRQGIKLADANPIHWLKALADVNLRFTSYVVNMQRAVAYLDGAAKAEKIEGMTPERAMYEGMHHANEVMGDLRRMSPLERTVASSVMPFYGWTKHILQYVLSFPGDHPWRAMMLANMAEFDMTHQQPGLPSRYQFLFFLGTPDKQGNVTALDARAMNPLRDVANYATLGGFISSLNPVITSTVAMVDPQITFGANTLYPNLTYDQFYGIETAGPQGNLLTAAEGIVPQIGAIQSAMKIAGQRQGMNNASLVKNIFETLNIPMVDPQQINLKQEAARTALARYQVTKNLASNAWQTGDFSSIANLGTVPDPRNSDYETSVTALQQLYDQLAKQYPNEAPDEVAQSLPYLKL